ncbi:MAG: hypothetical protein DRP29_03630 [Thermodesulfobacteriota bacterium]|nr:MAG: hypothetical protein DRP29_03630 [Thermodesulfobacteriota bacterium]
MILRYKAQKMFDLNLSKKFLNFYYRNCQGLIEIRVISPDKTGARSFFLSRADEIGKLLEKLRKTRCHICFSAATRKQRTGTKRAVFYLPALWADIDKESYKLNGLPEPTIIINSGRGKHLYWMLERPLRLEPQWKIPLIEAVLDGIAERIGADKNTKDVSRVLRLPGSVNFKYEPPVPVTLHSYSGRRYRLSTFLPFKKKVRKNTLKPPGIRPGLMEDLELMIENCSFIQWCRDNQEDVSEPLWYAMISNLVAFENGEYYAHIFSCKHPKYTKRETDYKIHRAKTHTRPHTCHYIKTHGFNCGLCPWSGKVKSPAGIPYKLKRYEIINKKL